MSADAFKEKTFKRKNLKGLALNASAPATAKPYNAEDDRRPDPLELGVEFVMDLKSEDLQFVKELGAGNGGTVNLVFHTTTKKNMARKIIHVEANKEVRKRIVRELQIMHECKSAFIVDFYGAFLNDSGAVVMCMEFMDRGSLDSISKNFGPVRVDVLGKIAEAVLGGLAYLYSAHRIMHRDIKPSNVLVNSKGQIKLCDFGVSSELVNSVADTFVGTGTYMAPERISGSPYTVKSDVWSVGLTLMELAIGKFPFGNSSQDDDDDDDDNDDESGGPQGILDLLQQIVMEEPPKLPKSDAFPKILDDMIAKCLMKDPELRPTPQQLYETDAFLKAAKRTPVDLAGWATSMVVRPASVTKLPEPATAAAAAEPENERPAKTTSTSRSSAREDSRRPTTSSSTSSTRDPTPVRGEASRSTTRNHSHGSKSRTRMEESSSTSNTLDLPIRSGTPSSSTSRVGRRP